MHHNCVYNPDTLSFSSNIVVAQLISAPSSVAVCSATDLTHPSKNIIGNGSLLLKEDLFTAICCFVSLELEYIIQSGSESK